MSPWCLPGVRNQGLFARLPLSFGAVAPPPPGSCIPLPAGALLIAAGQKIIDHVRDRKNAAPAGITRSQGGAAYADGRAKESESR